METIKVNEKEFKIIKLLGKGKGGYSYLVSDDKEKYVVKQIHHEPCEYYQFGNKIQSELSDYNKLYSTGIRMPKMLDIDIENERILKEFIDGYTIYELALENKGNPEVINQLWEKQENYFTNSTNSNVLVIADTSGSMSSYNNIPISSAVGLAIYLAERNTGIFHNKFINFSSNPTLQTISGSNLTEILENLDYDNWDSTTNINSAMSLILKATKKSRDDAPSHLLIISDMEFDSCVEEKTNYSYWKEEYQKYGIKMPKIIFWNVAGNSLGIPVTKNEDGVAIVSGFSSSIFKGIFDIENYNPIEVMKEILKPYMDLITLE